MNILDLTNEIDHLNDCLEKTMSELERIKGMIPEGISLRVARHGKGYQYFARKKGRNTNGSYIKSSDRETAVLLAQMEYDERLMATLQKSISSLKDCKDLFRWNPFESALNQMVMGKRELVKMPYVSDDCYVMNWKNQEYEGLGFKDGFPEFYTRKGLRVRSKSEVIIADILDELCIPFLYEKPLELKSGTIHPDFTLLDVKERKDVYWEHFGMMDDVEYRCNAFSKIKNYESNGLYQFDSVIWTFETTRNPINTWTLRKMAGVLRKKLGYYD